MAVLNAWQKLTRINAGKPFGDGRDGDYTSTSIPTILYKTCTGTISTTTLTASTSSPFTVGDIVMIHQTRGTGVGQWEINCIQTVGSGQYTVTNSLNYGYASGAQVVRIPQYSSINIASGTWNTTNWTSANLYGGIFPIACNGIVTMANSIVVSGNAGGNPNPTEGIGFIGGVDGNFQAQAYSGEGSAGASVAQSTANGNGGGGAKANSSSGTYVGGGGGGHYSSGGNGTGHGTYTVGVGGNTSGSADLTSMTFGGAGGGGGVDQSGPSGQGGSGGGIIALFVKTFTLTGSMVNSGGNGSFIVGGGGGGAGGSTLIVCESATIGTNYITAIAGAGADGGNVSKGGDGSVGRITIHYLNTPSGTSNPTFTGVQDSTLVQSGDVKVFMFN